MPSATKSGEQPIVAEKSVFGSQPSAALQLEQDPVKRQNAYGRRAIPKLIEDIESIDRATQEAALVSLALAARRPENVAAALQEDAVHKLNGLLDGSLDEDLLIRQKPIETLYHLACQMVGLKALVANHTVASLVRLIKMEDHFSRLHILKALELLSQEAEAVKQMNDVHLAKELVSRIPTEQLDCMATALATLKGIIQKTPDVVFAVTQTLPTLHQLLNINNPSEIKANACDCLLNLCFLSAAKEAVLPLGTLQALVRLLDDRKSEVRAAAAGAIMRQSITVLVEAKKLASRERVFDVFIERIDDTNETVQLNVLKCIANLAEDPSGRYAFQKALPKLDVVKTSKNEMVSKAAHRAIEIITWRP